MIVVLAVAATLWLACLIARPERPTGTDETAWFVYVRALGGVERLRIAALVATILLFAATVLSIARAPDRDLALQRNPECTEQGERIACWYLDGNNQWQWGTRP